MISYFDKARLIWQKIIACISPPFCEYCRLFLDSNTIYCADCMQLIKPVVTHLLPVNTRYQMPIYSVGSYVEPIKQLILAKSYANQLASWQLGQLMWDRTLISSRTFDYIVPIPLHWTRYAYRGYNQAGVIADYLGAKSNKPVKHMLKRLRRTPFLSAVLPRQRPLLMAGIFQVVNGHEITGKHILLVDDVCTTGSTLIAAARAIAVYKPASIQAIVAARVI